MYSLLINKGIFKMLNNIIESLTNHICAVHVVDGDHNEHTVLDLECNRSGTIEKPTVTFRIDKKIVTIEEREINSENIINEIDSKILKLLNKVAIRSNLKYEDRNISKYKNFVGEFPSLHLLINSACNRIAQATRRGAGNFAVIPTSFVLTFEKLVRNTSCFQPASECGDSAKKCSKFVGILFNSIRVYHDENQKDILVGYHGENSLVDTGLHYCIKNSHPIYNIGEESTGLIIYDGHTEIKPEFYHIVELEDKQNNDFTIECWVNPTSNEHNYCVFDGDIGSFFIKNGYVYFNSINDRTLDINTQNHGQIPLNTWTHIALVKNNNNISLYINGCCKVGIIYTSNNKVPAFLNEQLNNCNAPPTLYVNNIYVRITNGHARYTNNFEPTKNKLGDFPVTAYTDCHISLFDNRYWKDLKGSLNVNRNE